MIGAAGVGIFVKKMIDDAPQISPNKVRPNSFASVVLDQSGKELDKFVESAIAFIESMKKKYWNATHNCYAYVLGERFEIQRFSDGQQNL